MRSYMVNDEEQLQAYVVRRLRRRRLLIQGSASDEQSPFHSFLDELLEEILLRLPCSKSAVLCKCVCKHWATLISHPSFIPRFIFSKVEKRRMSLEVCCSADLNELEKQERSFAIVVQKAYEATCEGWMLRLENPVSNLHDFSVSALDLPCLVVRKQAPVSIMAACYDLLLCRREMSNRYDYFIHNVQTNQSLLLPKPPFHYKPHMASVVNGFICDPFYTFEGENSNCNVVLNDAYRYCAIVVHGTYKPALNYKAHLISSNNSKKWTKVRMSVPRRCRLGGAYSSFSFAGKLHFRCMNGLIGFDPYRGGNVPGHVIKCHYIKWPHDLIGKCCIGVRQGHLQIANMNGRIEVIIWLLKDYERGEWSLLHRIQRHEWISRDPFVAKRRDEVFLWPGELIGVHPFNPDIIYMLSPLWIVLCDVSKGTVDVATRVKAEAIGLCEGVHPFPLLLPIWPTPFPTLA